MRKAQPTSTKRLQVTTESQERWHNLVSSMWEEQMRRNGNSAEFFRLRHHFMGNVDEACIMASEGKLNVVGDAKTKKSDKCVVDS